MRLAQVVMPNSFNRSSSRRNLSMRLAQDQPHIFLGAGKDIL